MRIRKSGAPADSNEELGGNRDLLLPRRVECRYRLLVYMGK